MIRPFGRSIRHKVTAAILLTSIVSLAMSYAVLLFYEWRTAEKELVDKIETEARIVRENLSAAVAFQAAKEAEQMLDGLASDSEIVAAAVYAQGAGRMASFARDASSFALPAEPPPDGVTKDGMRIVVTLPIEAGEERIGSLALAASYAARDERYALYLSTASGMFLLALAIAVILSRFLEERISKPILALVESARRATSQRDYSAPISGADATEINLLAESFNQMLKEVNQRESQLTQAMDRLRLTLEASKTYTWEWDRASNRLIWHGSERIPPAMATLQDAAPEEILERIHPNDRQALVEAYTSAMARGDEFEVEFRLAREDDPLIISCRGKGFRDAEGRLTRALGVANDITQRRQIERALFRREQEFQALVEHSPDIIARYNRDLRVEYINPAVTRYTGIPIDAIQGRTLEEMGLPPERVDVWRDAIERIYDGASHMELEFTHADPEGGEPRSFSAYLVPELDRAGEVENVLAISRDITERKRAEQELVRAKERAEAAAQAKSVFLANMSHDIRTPLTAILGFAEILRLREVDAEMQELTDMIKSGGKRLMDTLNSVLDLARLEGGEAQLTIEPVDVTQELRDLVRLFQSKAADRSLSLRYVAPDEPVIGMIDRAAFNRAIMNVLGNALKFTSEGWIEARLWVEGRSFFVSVEDTGPGIPEDIISKIFDAFTRSRQSEVRQIEGSGLGMTITRQLVRLMDGEITVASQLGKGSVFTVSLPVSERALPPRPAESSKEGERAEGQAARRRHSILAVEDNPNTTRLMEMMLQSRYDVVFATSGAEALELANQRDFELVLMDISLETSESGIDCMRTLRSLDAYRKAPIIAFTAHALPDELERFRQLGFDGFLAKPFTAESLETIIKDALDR